jgi:ferredoxin
MLSIYYEINKDLCTKCGLCKSDCPSGAIEITGNDIYSVNHENCIRCGHCGAICPAGAVTCDGKKLPAYKRPEIGSEQAFQLVAGKRSVRSYKTDSIPGDILKRILEVGSLTATASNSMSIRATLFKEEEVTQLTRNLCTSLLGVFKTTE